jgi:hypothetical protein
LTGVSFSVKPNPSWIDIKAKLADFDRDGLLDAFAAPKAENARLMALLDLHGVEWREPSSSAPRVLLAMGKLVGEGATIRC